MRTQVAIVGGGPGGAACAIHLALRGIQSVIVERETFPRFHIGESLTGESGQLLREMGLEQRLADLDLPVKYGIQVYGPSSRFHFWVPIRNRDADGLRDSTSWQVRRSVFDNFLLQRAKELGTVVLSGRANTPVIADDGTVTGVKVTLNTGERVEVHSDVLVDASGLKSFLANAGLTGPKQTGAYARQIAVYSHFTGAVRDPGAAWGNTLTFFQQKYHWSWFIPLDEDTTSIGFVVPTDYFASRDEPPLNFLRRELAEFNPELARRTECVEMVEDVNVTTNYSYRTDDFSGKGWVCVGDAHRFIDPLFSFGVNITIAEARRIAQDIARLFAGEITDRERPFADFERWSEHGTAVAQTMLDGFWESTFAFGMLIRAHEDGFVDLFSGRLWNEDNPALEALRAALASSRAVTAPA
jgi:1H-pyrrole-2-carbonyl-[peptidyl-carrier protein] brominase